MGRGQRGIIAEIFLKREREASSSAITVFTRRVEKKECRGRGGRKDSLVLR